MPKCGFPYLVSMRSLSDCPEYVTSHLNYLDKTQIQKFVLDTTRTNDHDERVPSFPRIEFQKYRLSYVRHEVS